MKRYNPQEIEPKWQELWMSTKLFHNDLKHGNKKFYVMPMFAYPSGDLHIGHWYNFAPTDAVARFHRMSGQSVLHTNGFDSFGLPAENAAIKRNIPPAIWTNQNIESMTKQLEAMGPSYDWQRILRTSDSKYYRWTQWIFLQLLKHKLAYRAKGLVNWCPKDHTVLANEQVVGDDNHCERCGTPVIQKELEQWYLKITDYADRLLDDQVNVDWPERVSVMQENWIGRSQGAVISFEVEGTKKKIDVFTTRPDTIFGATYLVIAPEHPLLEKIVSNDKKAQVDDYVHQTHHKTELERKTDEKLKTGVDTWATAINPATGNSIPIWTADYVLPSYGTGAIMAVPAHDQRDLEFARKYDIDVVDVIEPTFGESHPEEQHKVGVNVILRNPKTNEIIILDWGPRKENYGGKMLIGGGVEGSEDVVNCAEREIAEETGYSDVKLVKKSDLVGHGHFYSNVKNKHFSIDAHGLLFDLVSDKQNKTNLDEGEKNKFSWSWVPVEEAVAQLDDGIHKYFGTTLALEQAYSGEGIMVNSGKYDGMSSSEAREKIVEDLTKKSVAEEQTNFKLRDWLVSRQRYWGAPIPVIYCDKCGIVPVPESDLPVLLPEDVHFKPTGQSPLLDIDSFVNTTCPECGGQARRETDTFDTFVDSSWYFLRYPSVNDDSEAFDPEILKTWGPVDHYIGGIEHAILHLLYARFITKFLHDYYGLTFEEPFRKLTTQGIILGPDGQKMSKSRGNVVSPDEQVSSYGADSLRLYLMFMGPYEQGGPYNMSGITGSRRFLERFWALAQRYIEASAEGSNNSEVDVQLQRAVQKATKRVSEDLMKLGFNTAISTLMETLNQFYKIEAKYGLASSYQAWGDTLKQFTQLLAPLAPHISEEVWHELGESKSVHVSKWPVWDDELIAEELVTIAVQINGKHRGELLIPTDSDEAYVLDAARNDDKIKTHFDGKKPKKVFYVKNRMLSLVF